MPSKLVGYRHALGSYLSKKYENSFDEAPLARVVSDTSHGSSQGICEKKGFEK